MEIFDKILGRQNNDVIYPQHKIYTPSIIEYKKVSVEERCLTSEEAVAAGWTFHKKSQSVRITKYRGMETELVIPSRIADLPVNELGSYAFRNHRNVRQVQIPQTVKKLGRELFASSTIECCIFADGVCELSEGCFRECYELREVRLPHSLKNIGKEAFYSCKALERIDFPQNCRVYGDLAFGLSGLKGFGIEKGCWVDNGAAFKNTPLHKAHTLILAAPSNYSMQVLLMGNREHFRFGKNVSFRKNAVQAACRLDLTACGRVDIPWDTFKDTHNENGVIQVILTDVKLIVVPNMPNFCRPKYVEVMDQAGNRYPNWMEATQDGEETLLKVYGGHLPPWSVADGNWRHIVIDEKGSVPTIYPNAFHKIFLESVWLGKFRPAWDAFGPIFAPSCVRLTRVGWIAGQTELVKYIPAMKLVGKKVHDRLLEAFTYVDKPIPRVFGESRHAHAYYFYDQRIVDRLFAERDIHQKAKILIAIDVLRGTMREQDGDPVMYREYLRTHRRFALIWCRRIAGRYPEYEAFLNTLEV